MYVRLRMADRPLRRSAGWPGCGIIEQLIPHPGCGGQPCNAIQNGISTFLDRSLHDLGGNGRACSDCHVPADRFQLSPATVESRFQAMQQRGGHGPNTDDPLFRPIDADDFRTNGVNATDFSNLRQNGLIRITFPLPPNIRLIDPQPGSRPTRPSSTSGAPFPASSTWRLPDPTVKSPGRAGRTPPAATNSTLASPRSRSRRSVRS